MFSVVFFQNEQQTLRFHCEQNLEVTGTIAWTCSFKNEIQRNWTKMFGMLLWKWIRFCLVVVDKSDKNVWFWIRTKEVNQSAGMWNKHFIEAALQFFRKAPCTLTFVSTFYSWMELLSKLRCTFLGKSHGLCSLCLHCTDKFRKTCVNFANFCPSSFLFWDKDFDVMSKSKLQIISLLSFELHLSFTLWKLLEALMWWPNLNVKHFPLRQ